MSTTITSEEAKAIEELKRYEHTIFLEWAWEEAPYRIVCLTALQSLSEDLEIVDNPPKKKD
jgi:hypothetical protein